MPNIIAYVIALYIRLSTEDSRTESMSIESQRQMLHCYVDQMEDIGNAKVLEFVDNGYSGTNFERPAMQKLLELVRAGQINCIIVKDFSRFGRNSIEVGYFMEKVFPVYGIRFISVNEGFDSKNHPGETGGLNVAFMYLLAEFYSRDLSVKSKSAKLIKMNKGEYQSKQCLYGYQKGADGRLEPDPETAPVIRLIFDLALEGKTSTQISKVLLERRICTPGEYRALKEHKKYDISRCCGIWQSSSIGRILSDERYAGTYIIGKRQVTEVGSTHVRLKDESEWIKIPDHHPALVSKEVFDQVQKTYRRYTSPNHRPRDYVLRGKVYCGCCRHAMTYHHAVKEFCCRYTTASEKAPCFHLTIPEQELEVMLYQMIEQQAQLILNVDNLNVIGSLEMNSAKLLELEKEVDSLKEKKVRLYEQMLTHELSLIEYKRKKAGIDGTLSHLEETAASLRTEINEMQMGEKEKEARVKLAHEISDAGKLTTELTGVLIDRVFVFPRNELEVIWKVKDFFA